MLTDYSFDDFESRAQEVEEKEKQDAEKSKNSTGNANEKQENEEFDPFDTNFSRRKALNNTDSLQIIPTEIERVEEKNDTKIGKNENMKKVKIRDCASDSAMSDSD